MKKIILITFLLSTTFVGKGQNLVPNGDFEQYSGCPDGEGQIDSALFWMNPSVYPGGGSPDYLHPCATNNQFQAPNNYFGYQPAHSGIAYCGIIGWGVMREYIEVGLTTTLVANQCYHLEMYMSLANGAEYTSDAMGAYFSNTAITGITNYLPLPFTPQIDINMGLNTDTVNWVQITGDFTANGGENYMIIGNYKNDAQTNSLFLPGGDYPYSYFYIDDVSLSPCTGIEEQNNNEAITIYPNPVKEYFGLRISDFGLNKNYELKIYNVIGSEVLKSAITNPQSEIDISFLQSGIYFLEINNNNTVYRKKFIKE